MANDHSDEYHGDINYGNAFPDGWYWTDPTSDHLTVSQLRWDDNGELITHHESTP